MNLSGSPPPDDGYEFIERDLQQHHCSSCGTLLAVNAMQNDCGHRFCEVCANVSKKTRCPVDGREVKTVFRDHCCESEIQNLRVLCTKCFENEDGTVDDCTWTGKLCDLKEHTLSCGFILLQCAYMCGEQVLRRDMSRHLDSICLRRPVPCELCETRIPLDSIPKHQSTECTHAAVTCQFCGEDTLRKDLDIHVQRCDFVPVKCSYGCLANTTRGSIGEHNTLSVCKHLDVVNERSLTCTRRTDRGLDQLKHMLNSTVSEFRSSVESCTDRVDLLTHRVQVFQHKEEQFEPTLVTLGANTEACMRQITDLHERLMRLDTTVAKIDTALADLNLTIAATNAGACNGTFTWEIENVRAKRMNAILGKERSIVSPVFCTGPQGYHLVLRVYLNGDGIGIGTHLSVFIAVAKGKFDACLSWPIMAKVSLSILDQGDQRSRVTETFRTDPTCGSFQRPSRDINTASGCPRFLPLEIFDNQSFGYIQDDRIFIRAHVCLDK